MMTENQYQPPNKETHFLVTGGGKGITAVNVIKLAETFQSRFTLIGRSSLLENEPAWAEGPEDETSLKAAALDHFKEQGKKVKPKDLTQEVRLILSSREVKNTLESITAAGGSGEYIQADITDLESLSSQLGDQVQDIDGVIHGAGALADKYIQDKTEADFDLVYGVKVAGIKNILQVIQPGQLNYLVLFSSVAGFYGNAGQADYSTANEILNKLAHHLKSNHPSCQVLSIGWGPWDGGMVTPQLKRIFERRNIPLITQEAGPAALVDLLSSPQQNPQFVIGNPLPIPNQKLDNNKKSHLINRDLDLKSNPFLADHVIGGNAVLPTVCAVAWFISSSQSLYPGYQFYAVREYRVFKGIVFEDEYPSSYSLEIQELEKATDRMVLSGKISSTNNGGKNRYHYQAEIELRKEIPDRPHLDGFDLSPGIEISGEELYRTHVLFHGPSFQGVVRVLNIGPAGLTTECRLPDSPPSWLGQFQSDLFDPILADVHLQSLLIWAHHQQQTTGLPLRIGQGIHYHQPGQGETTFATMKIKKVTPHKLVADVISHDRKGFIFTKVIDAEITLNEKLSSLFLQNELEQVQV